MVKFSLIENQSWPLILKIAKPFLQNSSVDLVKVMHGALVGSWCSELSSAVELIPKAPITTAADDIHKCFVIVFQRK